MTSNEQKTPKKKDKKTKTEQLTSQIARYRKQHAACTTPPSSDLKDRTTPRASTSVAARLARSAKMAATASRMSAREMLFFVFVFGLFWSF